MSTRPRWGLRHHVARCFSPRSGAQRARTEASRYHFRGAGSLARTVSFAFCLGLVCAASLRSAVQSEVLMTDDAEASIRLQTPVQASIGDGFTPVAIRIVNRADSERTWHFEFGQGNRFGHPGSVATAQAFTVAARGTLDACVFVPPAGLGGNRYSQGVNVQVLGPGVAMPALVLGGGMTRPGAVAHVPHLETETRLSLQGRNDPSHPHLQLSLNAMTPADWPADWRVWSPFALVVLGEADFASLDGARRAALRQWVSLGGTLVLVDDVRAGERVSHGLGYIARVPTPSRLPSPGDYRMWESLYDAAVDRRDAPASGVSGPLFDSADFAQWDIELGGGWLTMFMVGFAVVIGPLNLFWFAPANRRQRLFFTVPALSLAATTVLVAVIMLRDGLGGAGERRALVVLMPRENQAVVVQQQVARTGLLLGREFALRDDAMLLRAQTGTGEARAGNKASERQAGRAGGDWFTSRSRHFHELRALVPTRARVELVGRSGDGAPIVQSSVTPALRDVLYRDAKDGLWAAAELPAGQRVTLQPFRSDAEWGWHSPWQGGRIWRITPGSFYGQGEAGELAPLATLPSIRWRPSSVAFTGRLEEVSP